MDIRYGFYVPWSKVYRLKFLIENDINFDEVIASNDVMFSLKAGYLARDIEISDEIIYTVTRGRGSLTVNKSIEVLSSRYEVELRRIDYINDNEIDFTTNSLVGLLLGHRKIGIVRILKDSLARIVRGYITIFPRGAIKYFRSPRDLYNKIFSKGVSSSSKHYTK